MKLLAATYEIRNRSVEFKLIEDRVEVTLGDVTHVFLAGMDEDARWKLCSHIFKQAHGFKGTNTDVREIWNIVNELQDWYS